MRNLVEYPITKDEVIELLDNLLNIELNDDAIGNIDAFIISKIRELVVSDKILESDFSAV